MNMKRRLSATILLVLSLEAALLVAGSPSAAGVVGTIRLPSDAEVTKPARPWKCCNAAICTKSIPPICHCADEVQQCAPTCMDCTASASNPALLVCSDQYIGDPGPICRPWECCDDTVCTRSAPPTCQCLDKVKKCAKTCKNCEKADKSNAASSSRYVCLDRYFGWPGPKCNSGAAGVRLGGN